MSTTQLPTFNVVFKTQHALQRLWMLTGILVYTLTLNSLYIFYISPLYSYLGYIYKPVSVGLFLFLLLLSVLPALWLPQKLTRPSQVVYWILYLLVYVPSIFMPYYTLSLTTLHIMPLTLALFLCFSVLGLIYTLPYLRISRLPTRQLSFWLPLGLVMFTLVALVIDSFGINQIVVPSLASVYDVRLDFKEQASTNGAIRYAVPWLGNIFMPLLISLGLVSKNPVLMGVGFLGQVFLFSITGFKSVLFSTLLLTGLIVSSLRHGRYFGLILAWGAALLVIGTYLLDQMANTVVFTSFFVRRFLTTPGLLTGAYFEFFSLNPKVYLSHSIFEPFLNYPYDLLPQYLIGGAYFGRSDTYANGNFWADSYANFGFWGMAAFTLVLMIILYLFDALVKGRGFKQLLLAALLLGVPAITLANTALITSFITHGIGLAFVILFFLPRNTLAVSPKGASSTASPLKLGQASSSRTAARRVKVAHLSSRHQAFDIRIFQKECKSLAAAGYAVTLIVPHDKDETIAGVDICSVALPKTRKERMLRSTWHVYRKALRVKADLYHFHDPELLPYALLLKLQGNKVIYDVHEDLPRQILSKYWIQPWLRRTVALVMEILEQASCRMFDGVIAVTPTIAKRFPAKKTTLVQNFPVLDELVLESTTPYPERPLSIIFVGGITAIRGINEMLDAVAHLRADHHDVTLVLAGTFEPAKLEAQVKQHDGWQYVDAKGWQSRTQVASLLSSARVGLVLFHPEPNHINAQPNKLFEYMSAGVPVIASNFDLWRELIIGARCGLVVDPLDTKAIAKAILWMLENPQKAEEMGALGQAAVTEKYNWQVEEKALLRSYETVLGPQL